MLTQKELKEILNYNPDTGIFKWKNTRNGIKKNRIAGCKQLGYISICINHKPYMAHRLAWLYMNGEFPKQNIDHINRTRNDNRICNLRDVSQSVNCRNMDIRPDNTSGYKGVTRSIGGNEWLANMQIEGKFMNLGRFKKIEDAIECRRLAELEFNY